jgi:hypothetical protein
MERVRFIDVLLRSLLNVAIVNKIATCYSKLPRHLVLFYGGCTSVPVIKLAELSSLAIILFTHSIYSSNWKEYFQIGLNVNYLEVAS